MAKRVEPEGTFHCGLEDDDTPPPHTHTLASGEAAPQLKLLHCAGREEKTQFHSRTGTCSQNVQSALL